MKMRKKEKNKSRIGSKSEILEDIGAYVRSKIQESISRYVPYYHSEKDRMYRENKDSLSYRVNLYNFKREDISVLVEGDTLKINAHTDRQDKSSRIRNRSSYSFSLPRGLSLDVDNLEVSYKRPVLQVKIRKLKN